MATIDADEALTVESVSVRYGRYVAVESASLSVSTGEVVALIGPNGHGKSSLVNAVAGILPYTGNVRIFGKPAPKNEPKKIVKSGLVLVPERRHLYPDLSVKENILLGGYAKTRRFQAATAWRDVSGVLDLFPELDKLIDQRAGTLSGGQQQMVALARAMASDPKIIILDEPCLGLAEAVQHRVYEWLIMMARRSIAILLVEENPVHALEISDRSVAIYNGITTDTLQEPATAAVTEDRTGA